MKLKLRYLASPATDIKTCYVCKIRRSHSSSPPNYTSPHAVIDKIVINAIKRMKSLASHSPLQRRLLFVSSPTP